MPEPNIVGFSKNYWTRGAAAPVPAQAPRANAGPSVIMRTEQFVSKGLKGLQAMMVTGKTRLAQFEQELAAAQARGNQANIEKYTRLITNLKKKSTEVSTANVAAKYAANKLKAAAAVLHSNKLEMAKLEMELNRAQKAGLNTSNVQGRISNLQKRMTSRAEQKEMAEHKKNEAREAVERKKSDARAAAENVQRQRKALRNAVVAARLQLNSAQPSPSQSNRLAYATAMQAYKNAGLPMNNRNGSLGRLKYNSTGVPRRATSGVSSKNTHYDFIRNVRARLAKTSNPRDKSKLLDEALSNLSKRLYSTSNNRRALEMIDNYRRVSSNAGYTSNLNRRAERRKAKKNENKNKHKNKKGGWSGGGGQQIIFGQPGGAGGLAPMMNRGGATAPVFIPTGGGGGGAAPAPIIIPGGGGGGAGPSISVNPTIKVNVPQAAAQAATQMLPPMERSALNNAGGYRRAASLVQGAGGPESVSRALNALETSNGNVTKAMEKTGLPKNVFTNVNKLGGPVTARRALTAVKKVSRRTRGVPSSLGRVPSSLGRAPTLGRRAPVRRTRKPKAAAKKKYVSSACATCGRRSSTNQIKVVVSQLRRKNLEKNFLKCLLP